VSGRLVHRRGGEGESARSVAACFMSVRRYDAPQGRGGGMFVVVQNGRRQALMVLGMPPVPCGPVSARPHPR